MRTDSFLSKLLRGKHRRSNAVLFITATALLSTMLFILFFSDSREATREEQRKDAYGSWHIAFYNLSDDDTAAKLKSHASVDSAGCMKLFLSVCSENDPMTVRWIGYADQETIDIGRLHLLSGKWPETADQIAVESSVLTDMGYSLELGQKITLWHLDNNQAPESEQYVLTGVVKSYSDNWISDNSRYVSFFVSEDHFCDSDPVYLHMFCVMKEGLEKTASSLQSIAVYPEKSLLNTYTYLYLSENGSMTESQGLLIIILGLSVLLMASVLLIDVRQKRQEYIILRQLGTTTKELISFYASEKLIICLESICFSFIVSSAVCIALSKMSADSGILYGLIPSYIASHSLLCCFGFLISSLIALWIGVGYLAASSLVGNPKLTDTANSVKRRSIWGDNAPLSKSNVWQKLRKLGEHSAGYRLSAILIASVIFLSCYSVYSLWKDLMYFNRDYPADYSIGTLSRFYGPDNYMDTLALARIKNTYGVSETFTFRETDYYPVSFSGGLSESYIQRLTSAFPFWAATSGFTDNDGNLAAPLGVSDESWEIYLSSLSEGEMKIPENGEAIIYLPDLVQTEAGSAVKDFIGGTEKIVADLPPEDKIHIGDTVTFYNDAAGKSYALRITGIIREMSEVPWLWRPTRSLSILCREEDWKEITGEDYYTCIVANAGKGYASFQTDVELSKLCADRNILFSNFHTKREDKQIGFNSNIVLTVMILCFAFLLYISMFIGSDRMEKERSSRRYALLSQIGVDPAQLIRIHLMAVLKESLQAGIICSIIVFVKGIMDEYSMLKSAEELKELPFSLLFPKAVRSQISGGILYVILLLLLMWTALNLSLSFATRPVLSKPPQD